MNTPDAMIADVKRLIKECYADGHLDFGDVLKIAVGVAGKVNGVREMSGAEKKAFVLKAVEAGLREVFPGELFEQGESKFVRGILPVVLDIAVSSARGAFALQKPLEVATSWFSLCCPVLKAAQKPCLTSVPAVPAAVPAALPAAVPAVAAPEPAVVVAAPEPAVVVAAPEPAAAEPAAPEK
jgi:hypothetical protein